MEFIYKKFKTNTTIYNSKLKSAKGNILYFHGGGFIFGSNNDLPKYHIDTITKAGYNILTINYPLAPESKFADIIKYVICIINFYVANINTPYFLWGRSAGAYLSLLATSKGLDKKPSGIISYYGYGLFIQGWCSNPSEHYLKYPLVDNSMVENLIGNEIIYSDHTNLRFLIYLQARQTGNWIKIISNTIEEDFLKDYSLKDFDFIHFPPTLFAHGSKDIDVPYEESLKLHHKVQNSKLLTFNTREHDFDKNTDSLDTFRLMKETIQFLDKHI